MTDWESPERYEAFREFIANTIVPLALPKSDATNEKEYQEIFARLTDETAMRSWVVAYTHRSYNATHGENYEFIEFPGDRYLSAAFALFLRHFEVTEAQATLLLNHYLKGETQAAWSEKFGVRKWIWTYVEPTYKDVEDVFEAMVGTLVTLGEDITPGVGSILSNNFMASYMEGIVIDTTKIQKDPKTLIKEYFDSHKGWVDHPFKPSEDLVRSEKKDDQTDRLSFFLPPRALKEIAAVRDIPESSIPRPFVQVEVPVGGKDMPVFKAAYDKLKEYGFDAAVVPEIGNFTAEALARGAKEGYALSYFSFDVKETTKAYYQMLGTRSDSKRRYILAALYVPKKISPSDAKKHLSALYVAHGARKEPYTTEGDLYNWRAG